MYHILHLIRDSFKGEEKENAQSHHETQSLRKSFNLLQTVVNNLQNDGMKSMLNVHKGLCERNKHHPQCHTEGLNWNSLD